MDQPGNRPDVPGTEERGQVLVVEDDPQVRRAFVRVLVAKGHQVVEASDGGAATRALDGHRFDAILSDVSMPGIGGVDLLRAVRERDPDVPVILITGQATIESAAAAVEYGALRYLLKPVPAEHLQSEIQRAIMVGRMARLQREAARLAGFRSSALAEHLTREVVFARALQGLWMAWQPILDVRTHEVVAYEALVRTEERLLPDPGALFAAAQELRRIDELGRAIRAAVARSIATDVPPEAKVFVNLHPHDLSDEQLYAREAPLSRFADRVVLEITERAALPEPDRIPSRIQELRALGYRVAIDDLGAGYATLSWFTVLTPDVAKLDLSLVRGVDQDPVKGKLVRAMVTLCEDLGVRVVAEGVETASERDAVVALGCDFVQGYLFARPGRGFPPVSW